MTYEERMKQAREQDIALAKIVRGDRSVDITKSEDLYYQVNKDRMSVAEFADRDKFLVDVKEMKEFKKDLYDKSLGRTKSKHGRLLGEIPAEIYYGRKEFSDSMIPMHERVANMKKFFNSFPVFRAGDKPL